VRGKRPSGTTAALSLCTEINLTTLTTRRVRARDTADLQRHYYCYLELYIIRLEMVCSEDLDRESSEGNVNILPFCGSLTFENKTL